MTATAPHPIRPLAPLLTPQGLAASWHFAHGEWRDPNGRTLFAVLTDALGSRDAATRLWRQAADLLENSHQLTIGPRQREGTP